MDHCPRFASRQLLNETDTKYKSLNKIPDKILFISHKDVRDFFSFNNKNTQFSNACFSHTLPRVSYVNKIEEKIGKDIS